MTSGSFTFERLADLAPNVSGDRAVAEYRERLDAAFATAWAEARDGDTLSALYHAWIAADASLPRRNRRRPIGAPDPTPPRVARALAEAAYGRLQAAVASPSVTEDLRGPA